MELPPAKIPLVQKSVTPETDKLKFTLTDRTGTFTVVSSDWAGKMEVQLGDATRFLQHVASVLGCGANDSILDQLSKMVADANLAQDIKNFSLRVAHNRSKAAKEKGQEWAVGSNDYSELFERPTLEEAVKVCVEKLRKKEITDCVQNNLTKKE